jgi:tRNA(adenine34) deaminase
MSLTDLDYMQMAIDQAHAAEAEGEVPVGAIVVSATGEVIGRGNNSVLRSNDPTAHAEIVAMREAGRALNNYRLLGCTLYVTLEPCAMCAGAILHARLTRLVYSARDPKAGACGSVLSVMNHEALNHRVEVSEGLLTETTSPLLSEFFRRKRASWSTRLNTSPPEAASHTVEHRSQEAGHGDEESNEEVGKESPN